MKFYYLYYSTILGGANELLGYTTSLFFIDRDPENRMSHPRMANILGEKTYVNGLVVV